MRPLILVSSIAVATSLAGCNPAESLWRAPVGGSVSFNGVPLPAGVVRFVPTGQTTGPVAVAAIKEGRFDLPRQDGPVVGSHRVEIEATGFQGFDLDDEQAFAARAQKRQRMPPNPVPAEYNRNSRLNLTLSAEGDQNLDFKVETKPGTARRP